MRDLRAGAVETIVAQTGRHGARTSLAVEGIDIVYAREKLFEAFLGYAVENSFWFASASALYSGSPSRPPVGGANLSPTRDYASVRFQVAAPAPSVGRARADRTVPPPQTLAAADRRTLA